MIERQIEITTSDGRMDTFVCHPERAGQYPVVIFYMDAPGIREELRDMVRRLATVGYYVLLPNLYYRLHHGGLEEFIGKTDPAAEAVRKRAFELMESLSIPMVMRDTGALLAFASNDALASKGAAGSVGYCMSGRYAVSSAVEYVFAWQLHSMDPIWSRMSRTVRTWQRIGRTHGCTSAAPRSTTGVPPK
jgi:carboxymethylenebutenolidase